MNKIHDVVGEHLPGEISWPAIGATDATAMIGIWRAPYKCVITGLKPIMAATVTGAATNYFNFNVQKAEQGEAAAEVAHLDFGDGTNAVVGLNDIPFTTGTELAMNEGDLILLQREKVGTGLATPAGTLEIRIRGA